MHHGPDGYGYGSILVPTYLAVQRRESRMANRQHGRAMRTLCNRSPEASQLQIPARTKLIKSSSPRFFGHHEHQRVFLPRESMLHTCSFHLVLLLYKNSILRFELPPERKIHVLNSFGNFLRRADTQ